LAGAFLPDFRWNHAPHSFDFYQKATPSVRDQETISPPITWCHIDYRDGNEAEPVMSARITDSGEAIDHRTSRSICDAVGERLQRDLHPEPSRLSSHLKHLMDELRKRDEDDGRSH
jgi:hypothetical protein